MLKAAMQAQVFPIGPTNVGSLSITYIVEIIFARSSPSPHTHITSKKPTSAAKIGQANIVINKSIFLIIMNS
ncbi:hypothetical protein [Campylobacter hyointestinalis]|uniref:hypothetical protein n=1 Tax=Campylobacter hyointestinalis TaxID=198 RepID=UPI001E3443A9|nr:hypothetical protein [Campylobacter hyointestinalis]